MSTKFVFGTLRLPLSDPERVAANLSTSMVANGSINTTECFADFTRSAINTSPSKRVPVVRMPLVGVWEALTKKSIRCSTAESRESCSVTDFRTSAISAP